MLESLFFVQKLALPGLTLCWLRESRVAGNRILSVCGRFAFAIYFLHHLPLRILADLVVSSTGPNGAPRCGTWA